MQSFLLCPNTEISPSLRMSDNATCNEMIWENGSLIEQGEYDLSKLEFLCESLPSGEMTDYAVSDMGCVVISEKLKQFLDSFGIDNIQYFDATVIEREGDAPKTGYYAANIIGLFDCIDRDASEMDAEEDDEGELNIIFGIDKLILKDDVSPHLSLSRVAHFTRIILVDESLRDKVNNSSFSGIRLIQPEKWDGIYGEI